MSMGHERLPRLVFEEAPEGRRRKDKSRKTLISNVKVVMLNRGLTINDNLN